MEPRLSVVATGQRDVARLAEAVDRLAEPAHRGTVHTARSWPRRLGDVVRFGFGTESLTERVTSRKG